MAAGDHPYTFTDPDEDLWARYGELAERAFGHPVRDISLLRDVAVARMATRDGRVVAGGLGLAVDQHFGGRPVPSACLGAGCVAPEERGHRLADLLMADRLHGMRERGAVLATLWTSSTGYVRHLGFEAPTPVHAWTVPTDDLRHFNTADFNAVDFDSVDFDSVDFDSADFDSADFDIEVGEDAAGRALQRRLAAEWNGPVLRPDWWWSWKQAKSQLVTYRFTRPGRPTQAVLTLATGPRAPRGMDVVVHDLWAADAAATGAVFAFLGRHHSRAETIQFRRAALPPHLALLHGLRRFRLTAQAWHPWMLRLLDVPAALRLRGWPADIDFALPIEITGTPARTYLLRVSDGTAQVEPATAEPVARFSPGQLAAWYAGGYTSATAARLAGVTSHDPDSLTTLVRATTALDPWLPDLF